MKENICHPEEALCAYDNDEIHLHAKIRVRRTTEYNGKSLLELLKLQQEKSYSMNAIPQDLGYIDKKSVHENMIKYEIDYLVGKKELGKIIENASECMEILKQLSYLIRSKHLVLNIQLMVLLRIGILT